MTSTSISASPGRVLAMKHYGMAVIAVACAVAIRAALDPVLGVHSLYLPFLVAVIWAARYGGRAPGLAATALSTVSVGSLFIAPRYPLSFLSTAAGGLALFVAVGAAISMFVGRLRWSLASSRDSEERFRLLSETVAQLIWTCRPDCHCDYMNARWVDYTGIPSNEQTALGWMEQIHPDDRPGLTGAWGAAVAAASELRTEVRIRRWDGAYRWFDVRAVPFRGVGGQILRWFASGTDIEDRKRSAEALRRSEIQYRGLFEHMSEGLAHCRMIFEDGEPRDFVFLTVNGAFDKLTGLPDVIGKKVSEVIPGLRESDPGLFEIYGRVSRTGTPESFETYVEAMRMWFSVSVYSPEKDHFVAVFDVITERKRAEAALRESEERFRRALENIPDVIVIYDRDRKIQFINSATTGITGHAPDHFIGRREEDLFPREVYEKILPTLVGAHQTKTTCSAEVDLDLPGVGPRSLGITCVPLLDDKGEIRELVGITHDYTERKRTEEEIRRLNAGLEQRVRDRTAQLESANKELEAFSHSVSHDLRAPLRGIDGWSLALLEDYGDRLDDRARHYLGRVRSETQRMGHLIDDLLQLSRVSRTGMAFAPVDISDMAARIAARLQEAHYGRQLSFTIEPGLTVTGDARLLEIALTNLLDNAVKFTAPRAEARIEFGRVGSDGKPVYFVRDNGVGYDMAFADTLFGAFQRLHKASEFPGTGIGLATVQRVIHRHGGRVWAVGEVDRGATVSFTLEN